MERSETKQIVDCESDIAKNKCSRCNFKRQCLFNETNIDGRDISGYYIQDRVKFGSKGQNTSIEGLYLGCVNQIRQTNDHYYLGTLGLLHTNNTFFPNLVDTITEDNNGSFSICFNAQDPYILIGNNYNNSSQSISYSNDNIYNFYQIKVNEIVSQLFRINKSLETKFYITSGIDTFAIGDESIYNQFQEHFTQQVQDKALIEYKENFQCVKQENNTNMFFNIFPSYIFKFENQLEFTWEPKHYLSREVDDYQCFRIQYMPGLDGILLGTPWMMGYEVTFDQTNHQVKFEKGCSYQKVILAQEGSPNIYHEYNISYLILIFSVAILIILIVLVYYYVKRTKLQRELRKPQIQLSEA